MELGRGELFQLFQSDPTSLSIFQVLNIQPFFEVCAQEPKVKEVWAEDYFCTNMKLWLETNGATVDASARELISTNCQSIFSNKQTLCIKHLHFFNSRDLVPLAFKIQHLVIAWWPLMTSEDDQKNANTTKPVFWLTFVVFWWEMIKTQKPGQHRVNLTRRSRRRRRSKRRSRAIWRNLSTSPEARPQTKQY